jgi:HEPN domain-containing protein
MNTYEEWLKRARSSLELAKSASNALIYYEDLCFQAQQAVEKGLKGLLIFYKVEPEKTHNLYSLLQEVEKHTEIDNDIKQVLKLYNYAVQTRYPGDFVEVTKDEYEQSIKIAENCLMWITEKTTKS